MFSINKIVISTIRVRNRNFFYKNLHTPVLKEKAVEFLDVKPNKIFIDMTFGGGGHSKEILKYSNSVKIFALDRDPVAFEHAKELKKEYPNQIFPLLGKFSDIPKLLKDHNIVQKSLDGILFDFGCSSMQFDESERGFSLSKDGPLDMRMDKGRIKEQITAAEVLANAEENDLVKILKIYGEEKAAKKIAKTIVEVRSSLGNIKSTKQFADLVISCLSGPYKVDKLQRPASSATKAFQALRIFVNNELNEINYGMILAGKYLKINGRLVTITFHSLEDSIVKRHINGNIIDGVANPIPLKYCSSDIVHGKEYVDPLLDSKWKQLHKHVIIPDDMEVSSNPRSRSAKLRAAIRIK